jgi:hypothetical protein
VRSCSHTHKLDQLDQDVKVPFSLN